MITARELALKVLYEVHVNNAYSNIELNKRLEEFHISQVEKSFATELVYGVIKNMLNIDYDISNLSKIKLHKISNWIVNILRIGIYQIKYLDKIPESAAVNESVKLARKYGNQGSVGFVNGLLRNYILNRNKIIYPDKKDLIKYLSVVYSYPEWLIKEWVEQFGDSFAEDLCKANNEAVNISARVNTLKTNRESLKEGLLSHGIVVENGLYFENAILFKSNVSLSNLDEFKQGLFQIQDESSMIAANILSPKEGQTIVDVCAAPGGKSTHAAELMNNKGIIYSRDIHPHKLNLIHDNAKRLGIDIIKTEVFDASTIDNNLIQKADGVIVDAPCSGLGIIRRKPDIKWNRDLADTPKLVQIQKEILNASSRYVKSGGTLVYSTCTINEDENMGVVNHFLSNNKEFRLVDISEYLPKGLKKESCKDGYIQTYPNVDGIDGFFAARLEHVKSIWKRIVLNV